MEKKKNIDFVRYSFEAWKMLNGNCTFNEYEKMWWSKDNFIFGIKYLIENKLDLASDFRIISLDEEYIKFLKEDELENNTSSIVKYCENLTNADAYRLLKKNKWDTEYIVFGLPVYVFASEEKTNYFLNDDLKSDFKKYLCNFFDEKDIYLPGYILTQEDFVIREADLSDIAEPFFEQNINVKLARLEEQIHDETLVENGIEPLMIPFCIKRTYDSAVLNVKKLAEKDKWSRLIPFCNNIDVNDFLEEKIAEDIRNYFGNCFLIPCAVQPDALLDLNKELGEHIKETKKEKKKKRKK